MHARRQLRIHFRHPLWRVKQPSTIWIFADAFQNKPHATRNSIQIDRSGLLTLLLFPFDVGDSCTHHWFIHLLPWLADSSTFAGLLPELREAARLPPPRPRDTDRTQAS